MSDRMQLSKELQVGDLGETETSANFQRIHWAKCIKLYQDLGTDFLTFARDSSRNEYGLGVGLQVKSSDTIYCSPTETNAAGDPGWWHYESDNKHVDLWVSHGFPHLLVLTDVMNRVSYWQVVNGETTEATSGLGYRIFVPASNVVDNSHADRLFNVALQGSHINSGLQGSVWDGRSNIQPSGRVRHALMAPRLIAPHPNDMPPNIEFDQALALLVDVRLSEFAQFASLPGSSPTIGKGARNFSWRLVHAFRELLEQGESEGLEKLVRSSLKRASGTETAARVILAVHHVNSGAASDGRHWLEEQDTESLSPMDRAWNFACRIFCMDLTSDPVQLESLATSILLETAKEQRDLTSGPLRAAAIWALYRLAGDWGPLGDVVKSSDNAPGWWRSRTLLTGLIADLDESFRRWSEDGSITFSNVVPTNQMLAARWNSGFCCDGSGWRRTSRAYGLHTLRSSTGAEPTRLASALTSLRLADADKDLKLGAARLWRDGPLPSLSEAVAEVDFDVVSNVSKADLVLLGVGGDLLGQDTGQPAFAACLHLFTQPTYVQSLRGHHTSTIQPATDALCVLLPALPRDSQANLYESVLQNLESEDQQTSTCALKLLRQPYWDSKITRTLPDRLLDARLRISELLVWDAFRIAERDLRVREAIEQAALSGDNGALPHAFDLAAGPSDITAMFLESAMKRFDQELDMMISGLQFGFGGPDAIYDLFWGCYKHNHWDESWLNLMRALANQKIPWSKKRSTLWQIANHYSELPDNARQAVVDILPALASNQTCVSLARLTREDRYLRSRSFHKSTFLAKPSRSWQNYCEAIIGQGKILLHH